MTIHYQDLAGQGQTLPAPGVVPLTGLQVMQKAPALEVYRTQDRVVGLSRRVVLSWGLRGDVRWRTPNTDPTYTDPVAPPQTHPDSVTYGPVSLGKIEISPGCFLRLTGAAVPSGQTQKVDPDPPSGETGFVADGAQGYVRVTVVWTDSTGATETSVNEVSIPGSTLEWGQELQTAGGLFQTLRTFKIPHIEPPGLMNPFTGITQIERFSNVTTATITIETRGSVRCVDASISEHPRYIASTDDDPCPSILFGVGTPEGEAAQHDYPYAERTA